MADDIDEHDWYAVLGVPMSATEEDIAKAFRQLAKTAHPDRNKDDPNATARFHTIKRASEILQDPTMRATYDSKVQARLLRKKRDRESTQTQLALKSELHAREAEAYLARQGKTDILRSYREDTAQFRADKADRAAKKAEAEKRDEALRATLPPHFHITTVVVKWNSMMYTHTESDISRIAKPFGDVEAAIVAKSGGQATILFSKETSAKALIDALSSDSDMCRQHGITHAALNGSTSSVTGATKKSATSFSSPTTPTSSSSPLYTSTSAADTAAMDLEQLEAMFSAKVKKAKLSKS